jgi:arylsulfatase A-like enzyme
VQRGWAVSLLTAGGWLLAAGIPAAASTAPTRLNVVFILLDTVRPDHLGCYGYRRRTTPHLDALADRGTLFTRAYAQAPQTLPSLLSLWTSRYPEPAWLDWNPRAEDLDPATESLPEILQRHGYRTGAFMGFRSDGPLHHRLLTYRPFRAFERKILDLALREPPEALFEWLSADDGRPFFLFLHGFDAHQPHVLPIQYEAKYCSRTYRGPVPSTWPELAGLLPLAWQPARVPWEDYIREAHAAYQQRVAPGGRAAPADLAHLVALYDTQLFYLDDGLGRVLTALRQLGQLERTLIVAVSDHGQELGEHGRYAEHEQCYDEVMRIVLLVADPRREDAGRRVGAIVQGLDVLPTVLALAGLPPAPGMRGSSLVPLMDGQAPSTAQAAVSAWQGVRAIRTARWTLLDYASRADELYDARRDPGERRNVLARHPEVVASLQQRLDRAIAPHPASSTAVTALERRLREEGYW